MEPNHSPYPSRIPVNLGVSYVLWDTDPERSRELFRRAWDAAAIVDEEAAKTRAEEIKKMSAGGGPLILRGGVDLRSEVLRLAAKRDKKLGEEFLKVLDEAVEKQRDEAAAATRRNGAETQLRASKRLQLARRLVQDGEIERALEFAGPALDRVSLDSIFFLSALREKNAQLADAAFSTLLTRVVRDPSTDANTVSTKLVATSERSRASDLLEDALAESRRISASDSDRARALTAVAAGLAEIDPVRGWETLNEVVKAANTAEGFTGEDSSITSSLQTPQMVVMTNATAEDFDLLAVFRLLSRADLLRAVQVAKGFTGEAPRAVATLAVARSVLEKRQQLATAPN